MSEQRPADAGLGVIGAFPEADDPEAFERFCDALPIGELASLWGAMQRVSRREQAGSVFAAMMYFDHLPHNDPQRAFALACEVLRSETDKLTVMQLNDKFMLALIHVHGGELIGAIEREAASLPALRWLLGGVSFAPDKDIERRIAVIADVAAWRRDDKARSTPDRELDFAAMDVPELARSWIEQHARSARDQDDNFYALADYERELEEDDPDRLIDMIIEIARTESNGPLLALLAAGPLEDVISLDTIDRIEREAAAEPKFRRLLGGVWYYNAPEPLKARLDALIGDQRW